MYISPAGMLGDIGIEATRISGHIAWQPAPTRSGVG
jgi:hypothetical protein